MSLLAGLIRKTRAAGNKTATADTAITYVFRGFPGLLARLLQLLYTPAGTSHTLTLMTPLTRGVTDTDAAASAVAVVFPASLVTLITASASGAPASGDFFVLQLDDGTQTLCAVSAWNAGTRTVTVGALPSAARAGSKVFWLGAVGNGHYQQSLATGAQRTVGNGTLPFIGSDTPGDPLVVHVNNATAAGNLDSAWVAYCDESLAPSAAGAADPDTDAAA